MGLKQMFRRWQKEHPNFVTPNIIRLEEMDNNIIELSQGTGLNNETIFGVSLRRFEDGGWKQHKKCLHLQGVETSKKNAKDRISKIKMCLRRG